MGIDEGGRWGIIIYDDFSKHLAKLNYPPVDEKGFVLMVQALTGEKLFMEHYVKEVNV